MKKSWNLTQKILSGEKKIESRWYKSKRAPFDKIKEGEVIYFKDSGEPVTIRAEAEKVLQFSELTSDKVKDILEKYGKEIAVNNISESIERNRNKKYCMLIFLKNPRRVEPFRINKKGFGMMNAWISVNDINSVRI
jgi:S-adenosylmethionine:tRNA-ribosyltransferase-isomerase (queuine synthetase)